MKILVTRTDRLGDVMLATPVLRKLIDSRDEHHVVFLVQKAWMPVLQYQHPRLSLMEYLESDSVEQLAQKIAVQKFDAALVIRDEPKITEAVKLAGVKYRVGPYSTLRSFFSFNRGIWQRRSRCRMHEAEYNLQLLKRFGIEVSRPAKTAIDLPRSWVQYSADADLHADEFIQKHQLKSFICLHPGSSGSARYVSTEVMVQLVGSLQREGHRIVLTGTAAESALLEEIAHQTPGTIIFGGSEPRGLDELAALYSRASVVIAHGTGPLHLAAAVGAATYGIFPPIFVLSEKRWGPLTDKRLVWVPPAVDCPAKYKCVGDQCGYYDCMARFQVADAVQKIEVLEKLESIESKLK